MIVKPAIGFLTRDADALLVQDTGIVITSMTDNPNYTKPIPALPVVTTARDAFVVAINEAALGGPEQTVIKRAKRSELVSLMRQLAIYVSADCMGDMAKLLSSGFPVQKPTRVPVGPLGAPRTAVLVHGAK